MRTGLRIDRVYITHPAGYDAERKNLIIKAANNAGLPEIELLDEPKAAVAYYSQRNKITNGEILLVYDLGGGSFNTAVVQKMGINSYKYFGEPLEIPNCGGLRFDRAIFEDIINKMAAKNCFDIERLMKIQGFTALISNISLRVKHNLSKEQSHTETIPIAFDDFEYRVTRSEFENMIRNVVADTCARVKDTIRNAGIIAENIDRVLLVGGSSRIPLVQRMVREALKKDIYIDENPELVICRGAVNFNYEKQLCHVDFRH